MAIVASMDELDTLIESCNDVVSSLAEVERNVDNAFTIFQESYHGEATPLISDFQVPVKKHLSMLRDCYNTLTSYVIFAQEELALQEALLANPGSPLAAIGTVLSRSSGGAN